MACKGNLGAAVRTHDTQRDGGIRLSSLETAPLKDAGKDTSSEGLIEPRIGVTAGNKDAFPFLAVLIPLHGYAVSGVLGTKAEPRWHEPGSQLFEPYHANATYAVTAIKLGSEWRRKYSLKCRRIDVVVQQHPSVDNAVDGVEEHKGWLVA
jgi:hypothetical protein